MLGKGLRSPALHEWENGLISTPVSDENWCASVGLVIPLSGVEGEFVNWLLGEIKIGNRQRFKAITYNEIIQMVEGGLTAVKSKSQATTIHFAEILSAAKATLNEMGEITQDLIAKLIKFQILLWKNESLKETVSVTPKSEKSKSPKHSMSIGFEPSRLMRLKYRIGEGPQVEYIGDEPCLGPNLYLLLFGFHDANLISALEAVSIPLDTVIKIQLIIEKDGIERENNSNEDIKPFQLPGMIEADKRLNKTLYRFWRDFKSIFADAEQNSQLHDVIFQELEILNSDVPSIMCSADIQNSFRANLFTSLAKLMYKLQDLKRQYCNWIDHIEFIHIPSFEKEKNDFLESVRIELGLEDNEEIPSSPELPDTSHYEKLLENLPNECVTVPVVLHCMIEQVIETVDKLKKPVSESIIRDEVDTLSIRLEKLFDKCMLNYASPIQFLPPVNTYSPLLIYYGDEIRALMHHVTSSCFNMENISTSLVKTHPIIKSVMEFPEISVQQRNVQLGRYQNLLSLFRLGEITAAEIDWALKLLTFETMVLQTSDIHGNVNKAYQTPIPWDDPFTISTDSWVETNSSGKNFPVINNFAKGGKTICCASDSKTHFVKMSSKSSLNVKFCNDSKDVIQCECMVKRTSPKFQSSKSNKSVITNSRCSQCSKPSENYLSTKSFLSQNTIFFRNLQDYNYLESFPPNVFQQVLSQALNVLHCVDIIYYKRDPCHLLVLHNPYNEQKHCCMLWNTNINTNVNLRNFQLHVRPFFSNWINKEETIYDCYRRSIETSGKQSLGETDQPLGSQSQFSLSKIIGEPDWVPQSILNSLKNKKREGEGQMSPTVITSFGQAELLKLKFKDTSEKKSHKDKTDTETKKTRTDSTVSMDMKRFSQLNRLPDVDEKHFQGYDIGNFILFISGSTNYLYPGTRSQISVEKYVYVEGRQRIKITVFDQGNYLYIHPPIIDRHTKWHAEIQVVLSDGIFVHVERDFEDLLMSQYSKTIDSLYASTPDLAEEQTSAAETSVLDSAEGIDESSITSTVKTAQIETPLWLTFTLPNNLIVQVKADAEDGSFLVRQFFYGNDSSDELCRTITMNGNVIKTLKKNASEILQPDGSVLKTDWSLFTEENISKMTGSDDKKFKMSSQASEDNVPINITRDTKSVVSFLTRDDALQTDSESSLLTEYGTVESKILAPTGPPWNVLTPNGRQFEVQLGIWTLSERDRLLAYNATDPGTKEEYQAREDGLHIVHKRNRHYIAHHYDGTRITTYYKNGDESLIDTIRVEKPPFVTVIANPTMGIFDVQLSQNFNLIVKPTGTCVIHQKNGTQFAYHNDGSLLFTPESSINAARPFTTFVIYPYEDTILESYDHLGQQFSVRSNGIISVSGLSTETVEQNSLINCRYFISHVDGSGSELIHDQKMDEIFNQSTENSLCQIDNNLLPNNLYIEGFQIFSPMAKTCLDSWATSYEMMMIVPSGLTSKDLQPIPPLIDRDHRYTFGCGVGNGLHIKPVGNLNMEGIRSTDYPQVWQLRNFLKFRKMSPEWRELFKKKISDLNQVMKQLDVQRQRAQVIDTRTNTEQQLSASLLSLAKATGLPRKWSEKGIASKPAGADKSKIKSNKGGKTYKSSNLYRLRTEMRLNQKQLRVYRTTNFLPSFFKCQLGKEALVKIKDIPRFKTSSDKSRIRSQLAPVEEKTPPLLKDTLGKKSLLPLRLKQPTETKTPIVKPKEPTPIKLPSWAQETQVLMPTDGKIRRAKFIAKPSRVDFGTVKEGTTLRHRVYLKNSGIENSAIRVRQPQKETGISVSCTPLLVLAGMQAKLDVELHALLPLSIDEKGEGRVYHELEIRTEIETIFLPITAKVVPSNELITTHLF